MKTWSIFSNLCTVADDKTANIFLLQSTSSASFVADKDSTKQCSLEENVTRWKCFSVGMNISKLVKF